MTDLIKKVKISKKDPAAGETIRVHVELTDPAADVSINGVWSASEFEDETEGGSVNGGRTVGKNGSLNWRGLVVANDDPIDNDATKINFTISNDQAKH